MDDLFEPVRNSANVRCRECWRSGQPTNGYGWQRACLRGHAPCPDCNRTNPVRTDGSPRRCTGRGARLRHQESR